MKVNIRLGLAAGDALLREAVPFAWTRAAVAFASVAVVLAAGLALQHASPRMGKAGFQGVELQTTANGGIQVREGNGALGLLDNGAKDVNYTAGAQGSMRAQNVDPETGHVTVTNVYAN